MTAPELILNEQGRGAFVIKEDGEQLGEMVIAIDKGNLTVYHTGVEKKAEGKGLAKTLLDAMVAYARTNRLKVIPLCAYVHLQFKRRPQEYADIWEPTA